MSVPEAIIFLTCFLIHVSPLRTSLDENQILSSHDNKFYGDVMDGGPSRHYSKEPWLLHDLSSPIFMRFFDMPSTWIEAESICRKHFGHLVRDGNGNEAAVHDFLSSLDVHSEVWIGLHQATPFDRFHWIDDVHPRPPPRSFEAIGSSPMSLIWGEFTEDHEMGMCVSVDPERSYRWNTRYCNGPDKATFVCQIPVPRWIMEGCCNMGNFMKTAVPSAGKGINKKIEYFPHNDTVHAFYNTKSRTCTFGKGHNKSALCSDEG